MMNDGTLLQNREAWELRFDGPVSRSPIPSRTAVASFSGPLVAARIADRRRSLAADAVVQDPILTRLSRFLTEAVQAHRRRR